MARVGWPSVDLAETIRCQGGKLEERDENILSCASRELQEECGIAVPPTSWEILMTSVLKTSVHDYLLILCAVEFDAFPPMVDAERLGIETLDLFSHFPVLPGNAELFDAMRKRVRK